MATNVYLPEKVRGPMYIVYGLTGLAAGSFQVAYSSLNIDQPAWLTAFFAVYVFLGAGFGFTAASHTQTSKSLEKKEDSESNVSNEARYTHMEYAEEDIDPYQFGTE